MAVYRPEKTAFRCIQSIAAFSMQYTALCRKGCNDFPWSLQVREPGRIGEVS